MTVIRRAPSLPGATERLAWKSPCDEVGSNVSHVSDVPVVWDVGPMAFEDFARIRVYFAESNSGKTGVLSGNGETTDAAE